MRTISRVLNSDARILAALSALLAGPYCLGATRGLWLFDEGSGTTIADSSGNGHGADITWQGAGVWSTDSPFEPNASNNSYFFGPTEVKVASAADLNPSGQFTIEGWVNLSNLYSNPYLVSKRNVGGAQSGFFIEFYGGTFAFSTGNGSQYNSTYATLGTGPYENLQAATETWYHFAGVHTDIENILYINGISNGGNSNGGAVASNNDPLTFGYYAPGDHYFAGSLDEIRYSDVALTPEQLGFHGSLAVTSSQWQTNGSGSWSNVANWAGGVPNGTGAAAVFGSVLTAPATVTVDAPQTVGAMTFDNANRYTLAGGSAITVDTASGDGSISVLQGSHTISAPMVLNKSTAVAVTSAASTLTISGDVTASAGTTLTKSGSGILEMKNARVPNLAVAGGSVAILAGGGTAGTSNVESLTLTAGTTLDLNDHALIVNYSGSTPLPAIRASIISGYAGGAWSGAGLTSSKAATGPDVGKTALGYAEASALALGNFAGQAVDGTSVLVKYTYYGDANLDGQVDISDLGALATAWQTSATWSQGDFDYSGFVDISDLGKLATNWQLGVGSPLGPSFDEALASVGLAGVSVPEPAGAVSLLLGCLAAGRLRRR